MDLNKFMQAFGLLFVAIGTVVGLGFAVSGVVAGMGSLVFMGVCFLVLFCGIGGFFAWTGINNMNRERKINEKGYAVMGKIFDYVPDNQDIRNKYRQLKQLVEKSEAKVIILDMICFEYFILAFDKLVSWTGTGKTDVPVYED